MPRLQLTRRQMIAGSGALAGAAALGVPQGIMAEAKPVLLRAQTGEQLLLDGAGKAQIWGYNGASPGPVLRVRQGETLHARLINDLTQSTTVHWHGLRTANMMDGVPGLTQLPVQPGESFDYAVPCPDAGTFWYHSHDRSWEQVARGLCGALIVEEREPLAIDRDHVLVLDDWRVSDDGRIDERSFGMLHDWAHAGRLGNIVTSNGLPFEDIQVRPHERIRLRLVNAATARVLQLRLEGVTSHLIAIDGQPVAPTDSYGDRIFLAPGGRADLVFDVPDKRGSLLPFAEVSTDPVEVARFTIARDAASVRAEPMIAPIALPAPSIPEPDLGSAVDYELLMAGGAMGRLAEAEYDGQVRPLRDLARQHRLVWAMNGKAGFSRDPFFSIASGRSVRIRIINDTRWPHAMHLHGHHFKIIERSIRTLDPYWWDTMLMDPGETATIAFVADNPGRWMLHCHMLEHHAAGMCAWFDVEDANESAELRLEREKIFSICRSETG